jgi:adenosine deaminase
MNILLCTLGASWAVIPEIYGWLAPERLDLYAHHPEAARLAQLRAAHDLRAPDELWVCTTEGKQTQASLEKLHDWWQRIGAPVPLRVWTAAGTDQLAHQAECDHIRELTLRLALRASEACAGGGQLILSLAGGRKTMGADLQLAGSLFAAAACLHVVGPDPMPQALRDAQPETFCAPLPATAAVGVTPLIAHHGARSELLDIELDGHTVCAARFPLPEAQPHCSWPWVDSASLSQELTQRQQQGGQLLGNFLAGLAQGEHIENWRALYRLPPAHIERLRKTPLSPAHRDWLIQLPKADLHRHLGGCLSLTDQVEVARAVWQALAEAERVTALAPVQPLLDADDWPWDWPEQLKTAPCRAACAAALLLHASAAQLERNLYGITEPRIALKNHEKGFAVYERPGELTGSAILSHPAALAPYAKALVKQARAEGLAYLELRGSPHKYRPDAPGQFVADLCTALQAAGASTLFPAGEGQGMKAAQAPRIGFIWILDRRQRADMAGHIQAAVASLTHTRGFLLGLDLAGDEGTTAPEELAPAFLPAFRECLPITIHAGEGEPASNIWQAAYQLHADRIGHGLSLAEHPALASRFRDRGICLELCPSSNREVVGFHDPGHPASAKLPDYPLRHFIDAGLHLTLCTDNPGISRTTLADEYLAAARMSPGGLSQWEALALIKQGLVHAFLPAAERETLLKACDHRIFAQLSENHRP